MTPFWLMDFQSTLTDFDELISLANRIFGPLEVAGPHFGLSKAS